MVVEHDARLKAGKKTEIQVYESTWLTAREKNMGYGEIVACSNLFEALVKSIPMKWYFARTKLFQPFWHLKHLVGKSAGVRGRYLKKSTQSNAVTSTMSR